MIFASDLDRTLIYSERALLDLGCPDKKSLMPVEMRNGVSTAFMTKEAFSLLQGLCRTAMFVPVTTRTTDQFNRIFIFQNDLEIRYAVTANGANILYNGSLLGDWAEIVRNQMKTESCLQAELLSFLKKESFIFKGKIKQAEDLFFYYILDKPLVWEEVSVISGFVDHFGWRVSLQGRKLYFIPKAVSKGAAIDFICQREGMKAAGGAGDSILDWDFLQHCKCRFVPSHGELAANPSITQYASTNKHGVLAGEEILRGFLALTHQRV